MATPWLNALILPLYVAVASILILLLRVLFGRRLFDAEIPAADDNRPSEHSIADYIRTHGGSTIFALRTTRLIGCLLLLGLSTAALALGDAPRTTESPHIYLQSAMCGLYFYTVLLATISISASARWTRRVITHLTTILFSTFAVYFYRDVFPLATVSLPPMDLWEGRLLWPRIALLFVVSGVIPLVIPREYIPLDAKGRSAEWLKKPMPRAHPEQTASILSSALYSWLDPIIALAYRVPHLAFDQLPPLCDYDDAAGLKTRIPLLMERETSQHLDAFTSGRRRHVFFGLVSVFRWELASMSVLLAVAALSLFVSPLAINRILNHLEDPTADALMKPWLWIILLFLGPLTYTLASERQTFVGTRAAAQANALLTQLVFEHALRVRIKASASAPSTTQPASAASTTQTQAALQARTTTLLTVDLANITAGRDVLVLCVTVPVQVAGCIVFLWGVLGWSAFVGMGVILLLMPLPAYAAKLLSRIQQETLAKTDARVQTLEETMNVVRMIKMFGWEKQMNAKIAEKREQELTWIWWRKMLGTLNGSVNDILWYITYYMAVAVKARVSLNRLDAFLNDTELLDSFTATDKPTAHSASTELTGFRDATFSWADEDQSVGTSTLSRSFILRIEGEIMFKPGFNLVVGPTGSGKTSLLMALLGEMHFLPSSSTSWFNLARDKGVSYAAQESWVLNDTIKNNILFNLPIDAARYKKVLYQCCLERDLELFDAGDETEVGEKGLTLSGGQKARVTLARALYADSQVVILDDILAALDVHTAKWVVEKCLAGDLLKHRTVILVTHNVAMTSKLADFVVSVSLDGRVHGQHSVSEALATDKVLAEEVSKDQEVLDIAEQALDSAKEAPQVNGKLVVAEEIAIGRVSWEALSLFVSAHGPSPILFLAIMVFSMICISIVARTETWYMGYWASQYGHGTPVPVFKYLAGYCLLALADVGIYWIAYVYFTTGSFKASTSIHKQLADSILGSVFRWLDVTPTSRIITRFSQDINTIDGSLSEGLWYLNERTLHVLSRFISVLIFTPAFFVPGVFVGIIGFACARVYMAAQLSVKREMSNVTAPVLAHVGAAMAGLASVRAYGAQDTLIKVSLDRINRLTRASRTFANLNRWVIVRIDLLGTLFATLLAYYLVYFQNHHAFEIGFVLNMAIGFTRAIMSWTRAWNDFEVHSNRHVQFSPEFPNRSGPAEVDSFSIERIRQYIEIEHEPKSTASGVPPAYWPASGNISVQNLCARYSPDGPKVLHDLSFDIKSGERVGVVGRTGSGKSSLTLALLRCILTEGTVYYDGLLTSSLNLEALRSSVTIIPQTPELLAGSLRANLDILGQCDDATLNEALGAAGLSALQDGLEKGRLSLDSTISAGGNNLSVGERQIIALARAIVRRSKLLILDEATSAIDYKTDAVIKSSLRNELPAETTLITVAHRLHSIMDADKIMVLDAGRIVEFDRPKVLLRNERSMFRALVDESGDKEQLYRMAANL
ncbi:hypothetical protein C8R46DRAFT_1193124 [Mycena filopes]|nr:hypothetical protein C8R46DRAFT_1193124 [Mycena filopes]